MTHMPVTVDAALLARIISGGKVEWPSQELIGADTEFLDLADRHGVMALVADSLMRGSESHWPPSLSSAIRRRAAESIAHMALLEHELKVVLSALAAAGLRTLLIKGTGLGHSLYREPHLRPRFDTDLLVKSDDLPVAARVFENLGYRRSQQVDGDMLMQQVDYEKRDGRGVWHIYDLHWKIANPQAFATLPTFDELSADAVQVPSLGPHAWRPCNVHALLIACVHLIAHHPQHPKLIWSYDIHLLAERLDSGDLRRFAELAKATGVSGVCARALGDASRLFRTQLPTGLLDALEAHSISAGEPSRQFIGGQTQLGVFLSDLQLATGWTDRLRLIGQHVFPRKAYMLRSYGVQSPALLPALYTHRVVAGLWKWIRESKRSAVAK